MIEHWLSPNKTDYVWCADGDNIIPWATEQLNNKDTLLITIGDSWTWGNKLGKSDPIKSIDDLEFRLANVFGGQLSNKLNSDWINIAAPGSPNEWMIMHFNRLGELAQSSNVFDHYKKIYVVITLTEVGRDPVPPEIKPADIKTIDDILMAFENIQFNKIKKTIKQFDNRFKILVGSTYTDHYKQNTVVLENNYLDKNWCDLIWAESTSAQYKNDVRGLHIPGDYLKKYISDNKLNTGNFKKSVIDLLDAAINRLDFLDASPYNIPWTVNESQAPIRNYPNSVAHGFWANYVYNKLTEE